DLRRCPGHGLEDRHRVAGPHPEFPLRDSDHRVFTLRTSGSGQDLHEPAQLPHLLALRLRAKIAIHKKPALTTTPQEQTTMYRKFERRLGAAAVLLGSMPAHAETLRFALCYDLTKAYTFITPQVAQAVKDYAAVLNLKGGIEGNPIEIIVQDHGNEP